MANANDSSDLAAVLAGRLASDPLLRLAAQQLGTTRGHLTPRTRETFVTRDDHGTTSAAVVDLRCSHHAKRRQELALELQQKWIALRHAEGRAEAASPQQPPSTPAKSSTDTGGNEVATAASRNADIETKLAGDKRKMEMLARRRQEEVAKMLECEAVLSS